MIAELDVVGRRLVAFGLAEDEADAAVALLVGQDLVAVIGIGALNRGVAFVEGDLIARDLDAVDLLELTILLLFFYYVFLDSVLSP